MAALLALLAFPAAAQAQDGFPVNSNNPNGGQGNGGGNGNGNGVCNNGNHTGNPHCVAPEIPASLIFPALAAGTFFVVQRTRGRTRREAVA